MTPDHNKPDTAPDDLESLLEGLKEESGPEEDTPEGSDPEGSAPEEFGPVEPESEDPALGGTDPEGSDPGEVGRQDPPAPALTPEKPKKPGKKRGALKAKPEPEPEPEPESDPAGSLPQLSKRTLREMARGREVLKAKQR